MGTSLSCCFPRNKPMAALEPRFEDTPIAKPKPAVHSFDVYCRKDGQVVRRRAGWETIQRENEAIDSATKLGKNISNLVTQFVHRAPKPGVNYKLSFLQRMVLSKPRDMWKFRKPLRKGGLLKFLHLSDNDDVILGDATEFGAPLGIVVNMYNVFPRGSKYVLMTRCVAIQISDRWSEGCRIHSGFTTSWRPNRTLSTNDMRTLEFHTVELDRSFTHFPWG